MQNKTLPQSLGMVIILGSVWGLAECGLGLGLKSCASMASGSIMTAVALFFIAAAWSRSGTVLSLLPLLIVGGLFKMFDALLLSLPFRHGAVANPLFAFATEALALALVFTAARSRWSSRPVGQAALGGLSSLAAVAAFPLVKFVTGIPACVVPGTSTPLAWHYAPLAVGLSLVTVPLGIKAGSLLSLKAPRLRFLVTPAAVAICLAAILIIRLV